MRKLLPLAACIGLAGAATFAAVAQTPPAPHVGPWDPGQMHDGPPFMPEWMHGPKPGPGMMPFPPPPPPLKAAVFHLQGNGVQIDVKCADDEPMKVCVEAAGWLLDKVTTKSSTPR